ncbi:hypothetical protein PF008_g28662 [Phytophthora fragariae]|uniref:HAT C-terminal dimerisation domain-containing protein n=1 Tax=Phytophthora fragariae TaxID=53985 RepID=A0A6G0QAP9_9STRA|nr:hypothetical protein PF008_g28662 [Phytophthora fragariae]
MKCASSDCSCEELTATDPCVVCGRGVHHICSNDLYDHGNLSERFCSATCVYQWKTSTSSPVSAESDNKSHMLFGRSSQASVLSESQASGAPLGQPDQSLVVDLTVTSATSPSSSCHSSSSSGVDAFGIPMEVYHYRQQNCRHNVWDIAHRLETPYTKTSGHDMDAFTHVCLLCAQQLTCRPYAAPNAWEGALHRWANTSNARAHMMASHEEHPLGQAEANMKLKAATRHIDDAMGQARARDTNRSVSTTVEDRAVKRRGTLQKLWAPTQREIGIYIAHWLISAGMAYNTVVTEDFKVLIQRLTGDSDATILAASTFRDLLEAVFVKFCKLVGGLLQQEFKAAHGPFLNLHHVGWSTGNGRVSVLGTSASFIDTTWNFCEIALLLTVGNPSHLSADVQKMICSRVRDLYGIDITAMSQFTVSDTASSARKVSTLFEDSIATDCTMHVLNLCLQYAMGMRENKETVEVYDPVTNTRTRQKRFCTVGGAFEEGRDLVKRVRALNNYFSTQQRCKRLEDVQEFYCLPNVGPTLDCDTRVAFTVKLFQRTILNYSAFRCYFQKREKGDDATVFECLTLADWQLMIEMEAIVGTTADLARIEVQRNNLLASELIVLLKFAEDRLYSNIYSVCDLDAPRTTTTTVDSFPRYKVTSEDFSDLARICLARMKGQLEKRIAMATAETVLILMLDPRTKFSVESLISPSKLRGEEGRGSGQENDDYQAISEAIAAGRKMLADAHREIFCSLNGHTDQAVADDTAAIASPNFDLVPSTDDEKMICGAPSQSTAAATPLASLNEEAGKILEEWYQFTVDWVATAVLQSTDTAKSSDDFTPLLLVRRNGVVCWRVEAVCEHVDILRWFREVGSARFPSIAALARIWLGRAPSNAFQERVFSTGGIVMSNLRTRTDNRRAEMQVLLKQNWKEFRRMEANNEGGVELE